MKLYLIRHGKTIWNQENRFQGSKNIPLTQDGVSAAEELGKSLSSIQFDRVYSSPLDRAFKTAELAVQGRFSVIKDEKLKEVSFGIMEGCTYEEMEPIYKINPEANIMIVAHGALNKALMSYLENHGLKDFWKGDLQKNCQATIYSFDGKNFIYQC